MIRLSISLLSIVVSLGLISAAEAQDGSRRESVSSAVSQGGGKRDGSAAVDAGLGSNKDQIAGAVAANAGQGQALEAATYVMETYFPAQDPQAYAQCVVSNASRQELAALSAAAQSGAYEEAATIVADILKDPSTQTCLHEAGLPQLP